MTLKHYKEVTNELLRGTQPLTKMSTRNLLEETGWPASKADNLIACLENVEPRRLTTPWASRAC
jgi:hypothetical protein